MLHPTQTVFQKNQSSFKQKTKLTAMVVQHYPPGLSALKALQDFSLCHSAPDHNKHEIKAWATRENMTSTPEMSQLAGLTGWQLAGFGGLLRL